MKDVAQEVGVHQTTVSLALRDHPSIPQKTRLRIKKAADKLGYRPDPMLNSLIAYRKSGNKGIPTSSIGYIMNVDGEEGLENSIPRQLFLKGAKTRAQELGFNLDIFYYGGKHYRSKFLNNVLVTRNIRGIILAGFYTHFTDIELDWDFFSIVKIEAIPFQVKAHTIENNQFQVVRRGFQEMRKLGFKRIGLCVAEHDEKHTQNLFSAGYYVEQAAIPEEDRVPILIFDATEYYDDLGSNLPLITDWMIKNNVDAVISNWRILGPAAKLASEKLKKEVYAVPLDLVEGQGPGFGMIQNHEAVGASSIEVVASLMQINQRGMAAYSRTNLINGTWREPDIDTLENLQAQIYTGGR
jgi:LacI family transcriptional regulator